MKYIDTRSNIENKCNQLSLIACKALICEVSTYPSFGLVSPLSSGAHDDMDYYTFLNSTFEITPYFKQMAITGYTFVDTERIFNIIRDIGIECENKMYEATKGANTHKGLIFLMGVCITSLTNNMYYNENFENVQNIIKAMVVNILDDFKTVDSKDTLTHGEQLYLKNGFTGIRGQVKDGLDIIFSHIIKLYEHNDLPERERNVQILIELMAQVEDSTVIYRHNLPILKQVQQDAKKLLKMGGISTQTGRDFIKKLEEHYIENKISSGGCADLLAISIFLLEIKKKFY
ncbi:MAG: triphosphoribosyl-dephospho-CoA synthase CitG [Candidatus Epulonipiscium fishelsonii]|nr:MAG: triphosphoribosyl-dephospho-CoA synthase CitG [Epulopiscium sp. AS2M-Bin002]